MPTDAMTERTTRTRRLDPDWVFLQRGVAIGQVLVFAGIMLIVRGRFIPPLAVAGTLFAAGALFSLRKPRGGAIAVGLVSALWLGLNVVFASQVVPDLLAVEVTEIFVPTFAMNLLAVAGVIGLVGAVTRASARAAVSTGWIVGGLLVVGIVVSVVVGVV